MMLGERTPCLSSLLEEPPFLSAALHLSLGICELSQRLRPSPRSHAPRGGALAGGDEGAELSTRPVMHMTSLCRPIQRVRGSGSPLIPASSPRSRRQVIKANKSKLFKMIVKESYEDGTTYRDFSTVATWLKSRALRSWYYLWLW